MRAEQKGLSFAVEVDEALAPGLCGDPGRIRQVLVNLAGNAIKFTEVGHVSVRLTRASSGLRCEVADSGVGVSEAELARIFDPFVQADASTARRYGGTGLGLTISRRLVEAMGGRMGAESAPGEGSTFWFEIPLEVAELAEGATEPDPVVERRMQAGLRVLVVEDNPVNQRVAQRMLEQLGVDVALADDGRSAQVFLRDHDVDVVLMDVEMPDVDGKAATRWFRTLERSEGRPRTPVIALTAHAFEGDRLACLAAGMDDYLTKPIARRALQDCLARHAPSYSADLRRGLA